MNTTTKFFIFIAFSISSLAFTNDFNAKVVDISEITNADTSQSYLELYGQEVFKDNKCQRCHKLTNDGKRRLVSLDGLGGKYPDSWLYNLLREPKAMIPKTKMPSFSVLFNKPLDQDKFASIILGNNKNDNQKNIDAKWKELNGELINFKNSLSRDLIDNETLLSSEGLALIAYLQSIPISQLLKEQYEKENLSKEIELAKYEVEFQKVLHQESSLITDIAIKQLKSDIKRGKELYLDNCGVCHGQEGQGTIGPNLTDDYWISGHDVYAISKSTLIGNPDRGMLSYKEILSPHEVGQIVAYLLTIKGTNHPNGTKPQGEKVE